MEGSRTSSWPWLAEGGLTRRQGEVLRYMLEGWNNKAIARELGLSVETVRDHVSAVLRQLGVASRVEAMAKLFLGRPRERRRAGTPARAGDGSRLIIGAPARFTAAGSLTTPWLTALPLLSCS